MEGGLKVALPELEIGDIIDFYSFEVREFIVKDFLLFEPDEEFLISGYPILDYHSEYLLGEGCLMKFVPMNGAPLPIISTEQKKGSKIKARAVIDEQDIVPKVIEQRWAFVYRDLPVIRFIVAIAGKDEDELTHRLISAKPNMAIGTKEEHIQAMLERFLKEDTSIEPLSIREFNDLQLRVKELEFSSDRKKVEEFYAALCHYVRSEKDWSNGEIDSWAIIRILAAYCREEGIASCWIYAMPSYLGTSRDMLISDDMHHLFRIDFDEEPLLMDRGDIFLPLGFFPTYEEGAESFVVPNSNKRTEALEVDRWTIPYSAANKNMNTAVLDLEMIDGQLKGEVRMSSKGHESSGLTRNCDGEPLSCEVLAAFLPSQENVIRGRPGDELYNREELRYLVRRDLEPTTEMDSSNPYKALGIFSNWMIGTIDDELKGRFREVGMDDIGSAQLLTDGLDPSDKDFTYCTSIALNEVVQEIGEDRLLYIGPLIGSQVDIPEAEHNRKSDIRMPCARSYVTEMNIHVPSGYVVEGLDDLQLEVENSTGAFCSQAYMSGSTLRIRTEKTYKNAFVKADDWPLMLEFLSAAFDFSKKKVLLKKSEPAISPEQG
jgi:hypothetical protein